MECYTKEVGAAKFEDPGAIQIRERTEEEGGSFFRIQGTVNVEKPLRRGIKLIVSVHGEV